MMLIISLFRVAAVFHIFAKGVQSTNDDSPKYQWKALIGSFASSDSSSESETSPRYHKTPETGLKSILPTIPLTIKAAFHDNAVRDPFKNPEESHSTKFSRKERHKKRYLNAKNDPVKWKVVQEKSKARYLRSKELENEMLEKLPKEEKEAYINQRTQKRTMYSRVHRQRQYNKTQNLPTNERLVEIARQKKLKQQHYQRFKAKKQAKQEGEQHL
ncbi:uncharacterized protein FA14DRAFT_179621 [Meira miltonrushii]|uniref:Uncharacterized protein n=1 Tax=Meira miltonrushii TaxID=1280837 RepID=A0A316VJQ9_9BASI|nr:uncharacterized protein FA14DRAFT_179621 [Meira miltonrushii]PWN36261.1 hypothetical protein FA14DRAFT_179621 [Meira miltonrushii]